MAKFIINPETNRKIKVNGPSYKALERAGVPVTNRKVFPLVKQQKNMKGGDNYSTLELYKLQNPFTKRKGRGGKTRGWSTRSPQKGRQRERLRDSCGNRCFLGPNMSFPICPKCETYREDCECKIDCTGVESAYIRAQQWKYPDVAKIAKKILNERCRK